MLISSSTFNQDIQLCDDIVFHVLKVALNNLKFNYDYQQSLIYISLDTMSSLNEFTRKNK